MAGLYWAARIAMDSKRGTKRADIANQRIWVETAITIIITQLLLLCNYYYYYYATIIMASALREAWLKRLALHKTHPKRHKRIWHSLVYKLILKTGYRYKHESRYEVGP